MRRVLGLIVTVTHTIGVFALGLVTLALSQWIVPETLYPWLNAVAGHLGRRDRGRVLRARLRDWLHVRAHRHGHASPPPRPRPRSRAGAGHRLPRAARGRHLRRALPCPSALVVLLAAISLHRVASGSS